jgi:hypothetical protein
MGGEAQAVSGGRLTGFFVSAPINDPKHWHARAQQARIRADELPDPESKRRMLKVAENYEELARRAEKRQRERDGLSPALAPPQNSR